MHIENRRITHRIAQHWLSMRGSKGLPHQRFLSTTDLTQYFGDDWDYCFVVDIEEIAEGANNYSYSHFGNELAHAYSDASLDMDDHTLLAKPQASYLSQLYQELQESRQPLLHEGAFRNPRNQLVKYRLCFMPFGDDAGNVTAILGALRFKLEGAPNDF